MNAAVNMDADGMLWWLVFIVLLVSTGGVLLAVWLDSPTKAQRQAEEDKRCDDC